MAVFKYKVQEGDPIMQIGNVNFTVAAVPQKQI